jgi:ubiquinone/menaquinone biosynthesis C-methylase UbiE
MEAVLAGNVLQRARTRWLGGLADRKNILIVGEGPGRCLEAVCRMYPRLPVTVVEASGGMIAVARARLEAKGVAVTHVRWAKEDIREWAAAVPRASYDAVITPFVLDCFSAGEVARTIDVLARRVLLADSCWLVADFCEPEQGWRRTRARIVHVLMYAFFRIATGLDAKWLTAPDAYLRKAGFELEERTLFSAGLVHSDRWRRRG